MRNYFYGSCYKYRNFDNRSHLEDLIVNCQMMFSSPSTFNDPYDCRPTYTRDGHPAAARKHIGVAWDRARMRRGIPKLDKRKRSMHISEVMDRLNTPQGAHEHFGSFLDKGTGVFCMSKSWQLLTQWAYYAGNGSGLCLEFDVHRTTGFDRVFEISYSNQRPKLDVVRMLYDDKYRSDGMFKAVTHKAEAWSHETEVRALHSEPGLHQYPTGMLSAIMVGQSTSADDLEWLQGLLETNNLSILVYRVGLCAETFNLERHLV